MDVGSDRAQSQTRLGGQLLALSSFMVFVSMVVVRSRSPLAHRPDSFMAGTEFADFCVASSLSMKLKCLDLVDDDQKLHKPIPRLVGVMVLCILSFDSSVQEQIGVAPRQINRSNRRRSHLFGHGNYSVRPNIYKQPEGSSHQS